MNPSRRFDTAEKCFFSARFSTAAEKAIRSMRQSGVREAARQISRIRSGSFSDLRRERAALLFSLLVRGVFESGERIVEAEESDRICGDALR